MSELEQACADRDWWLNLLPPRWRLSGWTYRQQAMVIAPDGQRPVHLDGAFVEAAVAAERARIVAWLRDMRGREHIRAYGDLLPGVLAYAIEASEPERWAKERGDV